MALPLISIYLPTCNRADKLERALKSIFSQTYENYEILVCDDGSTDSTESIIRNLAMNDCRVRYFRNSKSLGAPSARNLGIFAARGHFITGLDDDDEFVSDRLEKLLASWSDQYAFICTNFVDVYSNGDIKNFYNQKQNKLFTIQDLLLVNSASSQIFTLTDRLQRIGGFSKNVLRLQDWDTWLRMSAHFGCFYRLSEPLYVMHHDHFDAAQRVSSSTIFHLALKGIYDRNQQLYDDKNKFLFHAMVNYLSGNYTFSDMLGCIRYTRSIKPVYRYLKSQIILRKSS